ncbi:hypothetical protein MLD38_005508 [Melastoma candidum]|uniref:Uncharacterized protein n=1 Tax=Melastoma candidum TaxID=119954 RepID=A0ACB9RK02_9MYRT|nr:hypothetical protein MLD38_005508 [Melastoma candidum]
MESSRRVPILGVISILLFLSFPSSMARTLSSSSNITAVFAFGDSTLDPGNNNYIPTAFRGDHSPYGRDFPGHRPTGRFSNGRLATDFIVSSLNIKNLLPPYLDPNLPDDDLITGVSFASAGMGLDDLTNHGSGVLSMNRQLDYFDEASARIQKKVGSEEAHRIIANAVFVISAGTNDMLFSMYDLQTRRLEYSIETYHDLLINNLNSAIQRLHNAGARKFAVVGHPPIGCLPVQVTMGSLFPSFHMLQRWCVDSQNHDAIRYNSKLESYLLALQSRTPGLKTAYMDVYTPLTNMIESPSRYGFSVALEGCCGTGLLEFGAICNDISPVCPDPSRFVFFDAVHPTEAAYRNIAKNLSEDIQQLV